MRFATLLVPGARLSRPARVWLLSGTSASWGSYLSPAGYPDAQWKVARIASWTRRR